MPPNTTDEKRIVLHSSLESNLPRAKTTHIEAIFKPTHLARTVHCLGVRCALLPLEQPGCVHPYEEPVKGAADACSVEESAQAIERRKARPHTAKCHESVPASKLEGEARRKGSQRGQASRSAHQLQQDKVGHVSPARAARDAPPEYTAVMVETSDATLADRAVVEVASPLGARQREA